MAGTPSRILWTGFVAATLVVTGGLSALGATAASDRAAVEADFAVAHNELIAQLPEFAATVGAARDAVSTASAYSAAATLALPTLTTGLDAALVAKVSTALASLDDAVAAAPGTGTIDGPIARGRDWTSDEYRAATRSEVARLADQRTKIDALSISTDAVVAQTAALDQAVAALVSSLPTASASLLADRTKADQPSKDALAAAAKTAADATTVDAALAGLASYSGAAGALIASHDAAVAAEAAAAAATASSGLSAEQEAQLAASRARIDEIFACFSNPACYLPTMQG